MKRWIALVSAAMLSTGTMATEQNIMYGKSRVVCASYQMGVPVEAEFQRFTAQIDFSPDRPETSKIQIAIDTSSFEFDPEIDDEVRGRLWLDAHDFPQARFVSSSVQALGNGRYEANGTLAIKGTSAEVAVPFTYQPNVNGGIFEGTFTISRLRYNIGEGRWRDTSTVADNVQIKFLITTSGLATTNKK